MITRYHSLLALALLGLPANFATAQPEKPRAPDARVITAWRQAGARYGGVKPSCPRG